jgi:MOSC domain-containing protein
MGNEVVGSVISLWRYPVKSMGGEELHGSDVTERGLLGDRAYALIDQETGKLASAKHPRKWARLMDLARSSWSLRRWVARLRRSASRSPTGPASRARRRGWTAGSQRHSVGRSSLRRARRRPPRSRRSGPRSRAPGSTVVFSLPRAKRSSPMCPRRLRLRPERFRLLGGASAHDQHPSAGYASSLPRVALVRRFRPNIVVEVPQVEGFVENDRARRVVRIGEVRLKVIIPTPRCVMTTLAQGHLPGDARILRAMAEHNRIRAGGLGELPCACV